MILTMLLAFQVQAAMLVEKWSAPIQDGSPVAAFFDAGSSSLFVSISAGKSARVDKFDLAGKLLKQGIVKAEGAAGPMRAHFGKIYWAAGFTLWSFDPDSGKKEKIRSLTEGNSPVSDLSVARNGTVYVSLLDGTLLKVTKEKIQVSEKGKSISGLFFLEPDLYMVKPRHIQSYSISTKKLGAEKPFCSADCIGLEKTSSGSWITAEGNKLREMKGRSNRIILEEKEPLGRLAYIYNREPKDDVVVLPLPKSRILRAYRFSLDSGPSSQKHKLTTSHSF